MLKAVLAPANQEQNAFYPPSIYEQHYNTATAWLISKVVSMFSNTQQLINIIEPFLETKTVGIKDGYIEIPDNCRDFLDAAINVKSDMSGVCKEKPQILIDQEFKIEQRRTSCISRPITILDQAQWDDITTHPYKYPTYNNPIGCFFGKNKIKVCPFDIPRAEIRYVRNEKIYKYGYITLPDETYIFDEKNTIETERNNNAFEYLYKGIVTLYSVWAKDSVIRNWSNELKQIGLM